MTREELIENLRVCGHADNCGADQPFYERCEFYVNDCCVLKTAADMLEQDGKQEKTADEKFRELGYCDKGEIGCGVRYDTKEKPNGFFSAKAIVLNTKEGIAEKAEY